MLCAVVQVLWRPDWLIQKPVNQSTIDERPVFYVAITQASVRLKSYDARVLSDNVRL